MTQASECAGSVSAHEGRTFALAFDTANEVVAIGLAQLLPDDRSMKPIASCEVEAHRASNTRLLPLIDELLGANGVARREIACVVVGRGPGSFTGVRIAMACAKGISQAFGTALLGVSSLDAVAWGAWLAGVRGGLAVVADAMRREVYPVRFFLGEDGVERLEADRVLAATVAAEELAFEASAGMQLAGDALVKYGDLFAACGNPLERALWTPTGRGLVACAEHAWRSGEADPFDIRRHDPAFALPVYTRLSDAEESERLRLSKTEPKDLVSGVQNAGLRAGAATDGATGERASMHAQAALGARPARDGVVYRPLDAAHVSEVAALETRIMEGDAWSARMVLDELPRKDRVWWAAFVPAPATLGASASDDPALGTAGPADPADGTAAAPKAAANPVASGAAPKAACPPAPGSPLVLAGYAGCLVVDGRMQVLRVGVAPAERRRGLARELIDRLSRDARDLGASSCMLEVRASNAGAQALYRTLGLAQTGVRPRYYGNGEDALVMEGALPISTRDVGGMEVEVRPARHGESSDIVRPLILAIESSCDETAAAIVDGTGALVADVVASQIDFHARFGGVVPEIASRKHIEAICGVCAECFDAAASRLGAGSLAWSDLDAVSVTYAPGLVGALVVGVAFAKGAAWALDVPFIGVNHLEGHLYANKLGSPDVQPPLVASLVSGGNTMLVHVRDWGDYETLGTTIDDAVGEAFDKVAKALGLGYPGGPIISRFAATGDARAVSFPRAMLHSGDLDFSLSGLKTAVVSYINKERAAGRDLNIPDIAASFQQAVVDVQVAKAKTALAQTGARTFCLGGGVAANPELRRACERMCEREGIRLVMPPLRFCGDNAGMIALVALDRYRQGRFFGLDADAQARADLDVAY